MVGLEALFRNDINEGPWLVYPAKRALDEDEHGEEEDCADQGRDEGSQDRGEGRGLIRLWHLSVRWSQKTL